MKLIIQPEQGAEPLLAAIANAKKSVEIAVFRFDRGDVETALKAAVASGVKVNALIAFMNRGGEKNLRALEMRFLEAGITVSRTADDLIRYHHKLVIIDRQILCMLSFNFTHLDIDHSRGFGIITRNTKFVQEAVKLFEADCSRVPYTAGLPGFVVSPVNSRKSLGDFIAGAKKQLLIYDPEISDKQMIELLEARGKAGVEIRIIGSATKRLRAPVAKLTTMRLHTRTIIRDASMAFVGSQSLRTAELDSRRELGLIIDDLKIVKQIADVFETDWASTETAREQAEQAEAAPHIPKDDVQLATEVLMKELHPLADTVKKAVKKVVEQAGEEVLEDKRVKSTVKKVMKKAIKEAVQEAVTPEAD